MGDDATQTHIEIGGRRWRTTDPAIPEDDRTLMVAELMSARRAVRSALSNDDQSAERAARARVHDAKVALGERGFRWWDAANESSVRLREREQATARVLERVRGTS